jgi:hypothetical protein
MAPCCSWASAKLLVSSATRPLPGAAVPRPFPTALGCGRSLSLATSAAPTRGALTRKTAGWKCKLRGWRVSFRVRRRRRARNLFAKALRFGPGERTTTEDPDDLTRLLVASNISMLLQRWSGWRILSSMFQTALTLNPSLAELPILIPRHRRKFASALRAV